MTKTDQSILDKARQTRWEDINVEAIGKILSCDEARSKLYAIRREAYFRAEYKAGMN